MTEEKKLTRQEAINAKCKDCIHDPLDKGNWRQQVTACLDKLCPLWLYRPVSRPRKDKAKSKAKV